VISGPTGSVCGRASREQRWLFFRKLQTGWLAACALCTGAMDQVLVAVDRGHRVGAAVVGAYGERAASALRPVHRLAAAALQLHAEIVVDEGGFSGGKSAENGDQRPPGDLGGERVFPLQQAHPPGDLTQGGYIKIPEINNIGPHIKLA